MFPVAYLSTRVGKFNQQDREIISHLLKYLHGTVDNCLILSIPDTKSIELKLYIDSSFHTHPHSGACLSLGSGFIAWKSTKQSLVTKSNTECELVAASDQSSLMFHCERFLKHQGLMIKRKIIYQDNLSTIQLLKSSTSSSQRTAHINTKYFFLREHIQSNDIIVEYMPTELMIADVLTKSLFGATFKKLANSILGE